MIILLATSSFGEDPYSMDRMKARGLRVVDNPFRRTLTRDETISLIREFHPAGIIAGTSPFDAGVLEAGLPHLRVISRVGVGWDNVDLDFAKQKDIQVFRTPDAVTAPVAELAVGLILDLLRGISLQDRKLRQGRWEKHLGQLVNGKTLGLLGCGRIGKNVAVIMKTMGCRVIAYDPYADEAWHQASGVGLVDSLSALANQSDILSLHAAYSEKLRHVINRDLLAQCRKGVFIINLSRGSMMDEVALEEALRSGHVAGAALDVFEKEPYSGPLTKLENVLLTPHIGSHAREARVRMESEAVDNLLRGLGL